MQTTTVNKNQNWHFNLTSSSSTSSCSPSSSLTCSDGTCRPISRRCDGTPDCPDQVKIAHYLVIQTVPSRCRINRFFVGNWKAEGWHQIEVQQNQTKSPMRVLFVNSLNKSKAMVRVFRVLFRVENMVWSCLACARKLARKILILNILDYIGPLMIHMAYMP